MKHQFAILAALTFLIWNCSVAQSPQRMSYQAVIRDANNSLVINHAVGVRISIIQGSLFGASVYVETHAGTTNSNGLVTIEIGNGTIINGTFGAIDWSQGPYFLKTETDPTGGNSYSISGISQLMSVPYALYAEQSGTPGPVGPQGPAGPQGPQGPAGAANINGTVGRVVRFTSPTTGGPGIIRDNGSTASIGTAPFSGVMLAIESSSSDPALLSIGNNWRGIEAITNYSGSVGLFAANDASIGTGYGHGAYGLTRQSGGAGVLGRNYHTVGTGVIGLGNNLSNYYFSLNGSGGAFTGYKLGCIGYCTTTSDIRSGGYFHTISGGSYAYVGAITASGVSRKIEGNGTVNTTVKDLNDNLVVLSCPEAPENLFEDYGKGQLQAGHAHIDLDPIFAKNIVVDAIHDLRVFIQLEGDCNGVFVTNKGANGFDVQELAGGASDTQFTYHVIANRADEAMPDGTISRYSSERFAPAMGPQATETAKGDTSRTNLDQRTK